MARNSEEKLNAKGAVGADKRLNEVSAEPMFAQLTRKAESVENHNAPKSMTRRS